MSVLETKIDPEWKFQVDLENDAECWKCNQTTPHHHWFYDTKTVSVCISQCKNCGLETKKDVCSNCWAPINLSHYEIWRTGGKCWDCYEETIRDKSDLYKEVVI